MPYCSGHFPERVQIPLVTGSSGENSSETTHWWSKLSSSVVGVQTTCRIISRNCRH